MFCPQCGTQQGDDLRFCKSCGVNLQAVRLAATARDPEEKFDWSKTWVAEMFLSEAERKRRAAAQEAERGITPEVKRYQEIKAGVITSFVGVGVAFVLFVFMNGLILSGGVPPGEAEILSRVWVAGIIPFLVGLALIINGLFVSKRMVEAVRREREQLGPAEAPAQGPRALRPADNSEFVPADFSVTEGTTKHLEAGARRGEPR